MAILVACGWAGAVISLCKPQNSKIRVQKLDDTDRQTHRQTNIASYKVAYTRQKSNKVVPPITTSLVTQNSSIRTYVRYSVWRLMTEIGQKSRAPSNQRPTNGPTDRVAYRVACTRLKTVDGKSI